MVSILGNIYKITLFNITSLLVLRLVTEWSS